VRHHEPAVRRGQGRPSPATRPSCRANELEHLTRRYTEEVLTIIGPRQDVMAPDLGTDEQTMAWIMDTYSMKVGYACPEVVTGKPVEIGGCIGRREATGRGVVYCVQEALKELGIAPEKSNGGDPGVRQRRLGGGDGAARPRRQGDRRRRPLRGGPERAGHRRAGAGPARGVEAGRDDADAARLPRRRADGPVGTADDAVYGAGAGGVGAGDPRRQTRASCAAGCWPRGANGPTTPEADAILDGE